MTCTTCTACSWYKELDLCPGLNVFNSNKCLIEAQLNLTKKKPNPKVTLKSAKDEFIRKDFLKFLF